MRKMVEKAYRNHELRMADLPAGKRTDAVMAGLILEDVEEFVVNTSTASKGIGFKF